LLLAQIFIEEVSSNIVFRENVLPVVSRKIHKIIALSDSNFEKLKMRGLDFFAISVENRSSLLVENQNARGRIIGATCSAAFISCL